MTGSDDWRGLCVELALMVRLHEKERMRSDKIDMWRRARELLELAKKEEEELNNE